jgi:hypothetical protein
MVLEEEFTGKALKGTGEASRTYQIVKNAADEAQHRAAIVILQLVVVTRKSFD